MEPSITTAIADFCTQLAPHVPFCPDFARRAAIRAALSDFFKDTRSWRATIEAQYIYAADPWISANALAGQVARHSLALGVDDIRMNSDKTVLTRLDVEVMDRRVSGWLSKTAETPTGFLVYNDRRIRLYPAPSDDADTFSVDIELVLTCDMDITVLPDYVYQFHREAIINGAAWRLLVQPGTPWSDIDRAAFFISACQAEIADSQNDRALRAVTAANDRTRQKFYR